MLLTARVLSPPQELYCSNLGACFHASVSERVSVLAFEASTCLRRRVADEGMAPKSVLNVWLRLRCDMLKHNLQAANLIGSVTAIRIDEEQAVVGHRQLRHPALAGHGRRTSIAQREERKADRKVPG